MLLSKKIDVYKKKDRVILYVASGPGGWISAIWSFCIKSEKFELDVSLHSHGLTSLGIISLRATHVSPQFLTSDAEVGLLVHAPRSVLWHPSGERIVVVEAGRVFIFGVSWVSKVRRNLQEIQTTTISMKRANEIYCDQLEEEDQTEREEGNAVAASEMIGVKVTVRNSSTHIGASAAALACTIFQDISGSSVGAANGVLSPVSQARSTQLPNTTTTGHHTGRVLIGTESGAVLSLCWGLPGDNEESNYSLADTLDQSVHSVRTTSTLSYTQHGYENDSFYDEDEGHKKAHSYTTAGRLLATVICPAQQDFTQNESESPFGATSPRSHGGDDSEEHRDLMRIWQANAYPLRTSIDNNHIPVNGALNNNNTFPEVVDIGDISNFGTESPRANAMVDVDLSTDHSYTYTRTSESEVKGSSSHSTRSVSYWPAAAVKEIVCCDRNKTLLIVYGDGSFSVCILVPQVVQVPKLASLHTTPTVISANAKTTIGAPTQPSTTSVHTFVVHSSAKIHPVVLVAYPAQPVVTATVDPTVVDATMKGGYQSGQDNVGKAVADVVPTQPEHAHQPDIYQLGSSGAYRSSQYTSARDVQCTLDLTPSLYKKVTRMRKLVTGRAEEEISRVLSVKVIYDNTAITVATSKGNSNGISSAATANRMNICMRVVALVQSRHLPTLHCKGTSGEVLLGARQESLSIVVYDVSLHSNSNTSNSVHTEGREIQCSCISSVCVDKNVTSVPSTTPIYEPSLQLISLPQNHNTHILIHHADNRVTCRSLDNLHSVVFVVNPLPHSIRPSLTTVSVCMNRILITSWDNSTPAGKQHASKSGAQPPDTTKSLHHMSSHSTQTDSTTAHHAYVTGKHALPSVPHINTGDSRIVILPILTSVTCKGLQSQNKLMYVDMGEGALHRIDTHASQHTPMPTASDNRERSDTQDCITTYTNNTTAKATSIASIINSNTDTLDNNNIYSAPLVTTQLKLPRKLLSDVQHYRSLCSINNPFQTRKLFRNVQEGLLIASSQQCREENFYPVLYNKHGVCNHIDNGNVTHHGASGAKTEYLAMIAGGSRVPYKHTSSAPSATTISTTHTRNHTTSSYTTANAPLRKYTPLLWVYNTSTCRWRSTYLIAGNAESSACLVKDIPSVHSLRKDANIHLYTTTKDNIKVVKLSNKIPSSASVDSVSTNTTNLALRSGSIDSHHSAEVTASSTKSTKRRNSDNSVTLSSQNHTLTRTGSDPPETPTINNASKGFNVRSLFSFTNNANKSCADETDAAHVYKPSTNVPINNRSHMAGSASSILSIAWYNVHSIVLLTLRRSTYCIEIISREASKRSMSTGKLQPLVHKIIMLPPGYSPNSLECIVVPSEHSVGNGQANNTSGYNVHTPLASDKGVLSPTLHTHTIDEGNESGTDSSSEDSDIVDTELPAEINSNNNNNSVFALQPPTPLSVHSSTKSTAYKPVSTKSVNTDTNAAAAGLSGCVVVVSDNTTLLCYHVQAQGTYVTSVAGSSKHSSKANTRNNTIVAANAQTLQVNDYLVTELWDLNLPSLTVIDARPSTVSTIRSTDSLPVPGIQFPVKDVKVFIQNTPFNDAQVEGFHRMSLCYHHPNQSAVPVFPVVSLHILDYTGNAFSVDAENGVCTYLSGNVNSISAVSNRDVCVNSMVRSTRDASDENSSSATRPSSLHTAVIASPLLLHTTHDPAGDAQRDLLYIFEKTSLIQHIRPEALSIQRNLLHYAPQLLVPVNILVKHHSDKSDVHSFSDTDLQRRHKRMYTMQTGHISAQLSYANSDNTVLHTHKGLFVTLGTKVVIISDSMRSRKNGCKATDKHNTAVNTDVLEFVPYLCTAFSHCLHSDADVHGHPMAQLSLYNTTDIPATATNVHLQHSILQTLSAQLLHKMRSSIRYSALLIAYMEYSVMQYTLQAGFSYKHPQYAALTQFMYEHDPCLLGEVLSRLGRKLEPVVSHQLFPVQVQDSSIAPQTTSVVRLYESFLQCRHNHHAARVLSLACECIGGSESHITTTASLILALELLHYSMKYTSLRNVVECVDFCSRLECMLVMHSRNIFGVYGGATVGIDGHSGDRISNGSVVTTPHSPRSLDNSYTSTVKSKALSLIQHHRDLVYRQTRYTIQQTAESMKVPDFNDTVFTPTAAASPALPFYLGMGVNWILTKAVNSLIPETVHRNNHSQVPVPLQLGNGTAGNNTANSGVRGITGLSLNVNTSIVHSTSTVYSKDDYLRQCMLPSYASYASIRTVSLADTSVYHYKVIDMLEQHYGPVAVSQMLSRTHLTPAVHTSVRSVSNDSRGDNRAHSGGDGHGATSNTTGVVPSIVMTAIAPSGVSNAHIGDQSPTALLLVHTLRNYFSASTHYVNAAVLLVALLQHTTTVQLLHHYLMSMHGSNNTNNAEDVGATSKEKVRRILYVYRLNKVLSRTSITHSNSMNISHHSNEGISKMLTQRVSAQYLRRVVEADVIHYHASHHSYTNNNININMVNRANMISETPRLAGTPGGTVAVTSGTASEATSPHISHAPPAATVHSPHNTDRRAYFELTEELLLQNKEGTIKTGTKDSNGRHLNLLTILKSLAVGLLLVGDSVAACLLLQTIIPYLKHIDSGLYSVLSALPPVQNVAHTSAGASNEDGERQLWELSAEQLDKLFLALV